MKELPIPFTVPMVRAILEGRKTQTRRIVKPQPPMHVESLRQWHGRPEVWIDRGGSNYSIRCPYGQPGDRLYVKEPWRNLAHLDVKRPSEIPATCWRRYEAGGYGGVSPSDPDAAIGRYRHGRFMPRHMSRITLEIVAVRVERLQEVSEADAVAEGIEGRYHPDDQRLWTWKDYRVSAWAPEPRFHYGSSVTSVSTYAGLWESINGQGSWERNPWVWVVEFKRL